MNSLEENFISIGCSLPDSFPVLNCSPLYYMGEHSSVYMFFPSFSHDDFKEAILNMSSQRLGIIDVPVKMFEILIETLSYVKAFVFNICDERGVFLS